MAPRKGDRRIDAAINHFEAMGYHASDVHHAVSALFKEYGIGIAAWPFLADDCYNAVQEKLFKMEEEEKPQQEDELLRESHQEEEEQQPPQQQEPAVDEAPAENTTQQGDTAQAQNERVMGMTTNGTGIILVYDELPLNYELPVPHPATNEEENGGNDPSQGGNFECKREHP